MSSKSQRITHLENEVKNIKKDNKHLWSKVDYLTTQLEDSMNFIHRLKVVYEMQHPEVQEQSLAPTLVDDDLDLDEPKSQAVSLASTIVDEPSYQPDTLDLLLETQEEVTHEEVQQPSLAPTYDDEKEDELDLKLEIMNETYDDLDLLSDNEEVEELEVENVSEIVVNPETFSLEVEEKTEEVVSNDSVLIIDENQDEEMIVDTTIPPPPNPTPVNPTPIINTNTSVDELMADVENLNLEPPLPENLSTSPMPVVEEVVEEEVVVDINYKKMKVTELKKLCKSRGIKGYSKLKKKQLIELLSQ